MIVGGINSFGEEMKEAFNHLGFPDYFRIELAIAKFVGVSLLLLPLVPKNLKEWAYCGFSITLISASISHYYVGDPIIKIIIPILFLVFLGMSYFFKDKF